MSNPLRYLLMNADCFTHLKRENAYLRSITKTPFAMYITNGVFILSIYLTSMPESVIIILL